MDKFFIDEAVTELKTIQDWIRWSVSRFNDAEVFFGHGTDNAWDEAVALVLQTLHLPIDVDPEIQHARLTSAEKQCLVDLIVRRIHERVPVPYLTNTAWFAGMPFYVDERVLIPRSPIAELLEQQMAPWIEEPESVNRILDMCSGSGCIGIVCATMFPNAEVDLADLSDDALAVAEQNVQSHGLEHQVFPLKSDLFSEIAQEKYDLIICNPPYVDAEDMENLPPEYKHEPRMALAAGHDGLDLVKKFMFEAPDHLTENGVVVVEVGNSEVHMREQFPDVSLTWVEFERGGHGVFVITREQLLSCREQFRSAS